MSAIPLFERMPSTPLEHYRLCRLLLTRGERERIEAALRYPFAQSYQPSIAAAALLSKTLGRDFPPVQPLLFPSGAPRAIKSEEKQEDCLLPLSVATELAQLWRELGCSEHETASRWVNQFQGSSVRRLFYREESFVEEEGISAQQSVAADPYLGITSFATPDFDGAMTLSGFNTGLGALRLKDVSIPAFGPHTSQLSDTHGFGLSHMPAHGTVLFTQPERAQLEGWSRCHGCKESWLHLRGELSKNSANLQIRFYANSPVKLVFYVQAKSCRLENRERLFEPGSLHSYRGNSLPLFFGDSVRLVSEKPVELQIIPLAGQGSFWNANFLIAYTCLSNERISFCFSF